MKIIHRIAITNPSNSSLQELSELAIALKGGSKHPTVPSIFYFEIGENDKRWQQVQRLVAASKLTDFVRTSFSESEIEEADVLSMLGATQRGYPEPSERLGFLEETYDLSNYCRRCGTGNRQISPFRIKFVPELKRSIMLLNWVFDEYFVAPEVWTEVFEPFGIGFWPVLKHRTGSEISSVVQLRVSSEIDLCLDETDASRCSVCGRKKTKFSLRGLCPRPVSATLKIQAREVVLPVTVRDKKGALVTSLKISDFTLTEDGRPQTIKSFTRESNLPFRLGCWWTPAAASPGHGGGAQGGGQVCGPDAAGRSQRPRTQKETRPFLIHFDREVELLEDFTNSRDKLHHELDDMGPTRAAQNDSQGPETSGDDRSSGRACARRRHAALRRDLPGLR
jgi:hypothetical protein